MIANQGAHLYGVTAQVLKSQSGPGVDPETIVPALATAAQALRSADQEWVGLSTLTRASHEFLSESRRLVGVLKEVATLVNSADHGEFDHERAASDLAAVANSVDELTALTPGLLTW